MEKNILKIGLCLLMFVGLSSCDSDDGGGTQTVTPFTLTINGQQYLPTSIPSAQMSNSGRFMIISATNTVTDRSITLSIGDASGMGEELMADTYPLMGGGTSISYFVDNSTYVSEDNGQIIISSIDTGTRLISGTFQGVVVGTFGTNGTFTLANGEFTDIPFTIQ